MSGKQTIPPGRFDELRQMYERGYRLTEISAAFGVTAKVLREVLLGLNLPARMMKKETRRRAILSPAEVSDLLKTYSEPSIPVQDILERFDIPLSRLYAELQKADHRRRKAMPAKVSDLSLECRLNIVRSYSERTGTMREIAASEGLSYDQVYVVLRQAGIPLRTDAKDADRSDDMLRERFRSLYADGSVAVADILADLNITQHDMKALVKELELPPRGKGGGKRSIPKSIIDMMPEYTRRYEAGESLTKLAEEAGISLSTMKVRVGKLRRR